MIRSIFEFLISRSVDDGTTTTGWLRGLIRGNAKLNQFDSQTRRLDDMLRASAIEIRQSMAENHPTATLTRPPHRHDSVSDSPASFLRWFAGIAAAAVLLVVASPKFLQPNKPAVHAGEFSQQLAIVPGQVLRLLNQAAESSTTQLPQLSPLANLSLPNLPDWSSLAPPVQGSMQREFDMWQGSWQSLKSRFSEPPHEL